MLQPDRSQVTI